jgi:hypothetical protein
MEDPQMNRLLGVAVLALLLGSPMLLAPVPSPASPSTALPSTALRANSAGPILVVDVRQASRREHLLAVSIQGIANRSPDNPRVFLLTNDWDEDWLWYCLRIAPREAADVTPDELYSRLKDLVKGQVLYDPASPYLLDLATTAAGLRDLVISDVDLGLPTLFDLRQRFHSAKEAYDWAVANLLPECDRSAAALLPPSSLAMRDLAIARRLFTFSVPDSPQDETFQSVLFHLPPGAAVYGSATPATLRSSEASSLRSTGELRAQLSSASHFLVPAGQAANLSFLSGLESGQAQYQYLSYLEAIAPRYLTLILDCSDLDLCLDEMPRLWEAPQRGALPLGWAIPAALAEVASPVAHRYYADAYWSGMDQFVFGASGAGQLDLSVATAPYAFYRSTQKARSALDIDACLFDASGFSESGPSATLRAGLGEQLGLFASETGMRGFFLTGVADAAPMVLHGAAVLAAPRVASAEEAVTYLNRIPLERRCAALVLDARSLGPADAEHIAAHVADRYVLVPPGEMVELMREIALPEAEGAGGVAISSVDYTEQPVPDAPVAVAATAQPTGELYSVQVVYRPAASPVAFSRVLLPGAGGFSTAIPPLRQGGQFELRLRARDTAGRTTWSPAWTLSVPREDADSDGLSDAEEAYLLTDATSPDTDGDGLADANDPAPLQFDRFPVVYAGPIAPPDDAPYLPEPGRSTAGSEGRAVEPGDACLYWLPVVATPPDAAMVVSLDASGPAIVAVGTQPGQLREQFTGVLSADWYSQLLPREAEATGAFVRLSCPQEAGAPLLVRSIALVSPRDAPSVFRVSAFPPHPGPEQAITVSAVAFSPRGVEQVGLAYRVNAGGTIIVPMAQRAKMQTYEARIPSLENRDELEYWIVATDKEGDRSVTVPAPLPIGGRGREVIALLARRDFVGGWASSPDWDDQARLAPGSGAVDYAYVELAEGTYTVWILAGGRGQGIDVYVKDSKIGSIDPRLPDGWQRLGRVRIEAGRTRIQLVAQTEPEAPTGAAPRYAAVIITADSSFSPPAGRVLDIHNAIALLFPAPEQTLSGTVELVATGAGNITGAEFSLDGELIRQVSGPPFRIALNTQRFTPGPHRLKVDAVSRSGPLGLSLEVPVTIAP